jgi:hypothetical protein
VVAQLNPYVNYLAHNIQLIERKLGKLSSAYSHAPYNIKIHLIITSHLDLFFKMPTFIQEFLSKYLTELLIYSKRYYYYY